MIETIDKHFLWWMSKQLLELLVQVGLIFAAGALIQVVIRFVLRRFRYYLSKTGMGGARERAARAATITGVIANFASGALWIVIVLMALDKLGINITPLIASAGVLGLAVSFGSQEMIRDGFAGFFFLLENQFNVGSMVQIGDKKGTVIKMDLRTVILRDEQSKAIHIFRNSQTGMISRFDPEADTPAEEILPTKAKRKPKDAA